jgi:hypothetical protein
MTALRFGKKGTLSTIIAPITSLAVQEFKRDIVESTLKRQKYKSFV